MQSITRSAFSLGTLGGSEVRQIAVSVDGNKNEQVHPSVEFEAITMYVESTQ